MFETEIKLSEAQKSALEELAKMRNVSIADLIREGVDILLRFSAIPNTVEQKQRALPAAGRFRSGLRDLSKRHDNYYSETLDS